MGGNHLECQCYEEQGISRGILSLAAGLLRTEPVGPFGKKSGLSLMYVPSSLAANENTETEYGESRELVEGAVGTSSENRKGCREACSPHISTALGGRVLAEVEGLLRPAK